MAATCEREGVMELIEGRSAPWWRWMRHQKREREVSIGDVD